MAYNEGPFLIGVGSRLFNDYLPGMKSVISFAGFLPGRGFWAPFFWPGGLWSLQWSSQFLPQTCLSHIWVS